MYYPNTGACVLGPPKDNVNSKWFPLRRNGPVLLGRKYHRQDELVAIEEGNRQLLID
jgi:hypothetical protein